jgi:hypothetical protein
MLGLTQCQNLVMPSLYHLISDRSIGEGRKNGRKIFGENLMQGGASENVNPVCEKVDIR